MAAGRFRRQMLYPPELWAHINFQLHDCGSVRADSSRLQYIKLGKALTKGMKALSTASYELLPQVERWEACVEG
jgi:hypothetical protein